ncbi:MAG TPA: phage tail protein I [Candidatus Caccousia avicola]|uniref:Phage tail protein I n=1 Tax=Candidatus Caccousia avicola TaxID=2840721 RepID=A0A9D1APB5_9FIRM|nr:phage tail protein I [Candidatus Caccousia avicola]
MNERWGLTAENMLHALPDVLKNDSGTAALASCTAAALAERKAEIDSLILYARMDELPEPLLDLLAQDFKVDWWDGDYSLEEKRQTLRDSWHVHRTLGTKAAVETALSAIYPNTKVMEWWEYDGLPYHFRLSINVSSDETSSLKHQRVMARLELYKNLRSQLDEVEYYDGGAEITWYAGADMVGIDLCDGCTAREW